MDKALYECSRPILGSILGSKIDALSCKPHVFLIGSQLRAANLMLSRSDRKPTVFSIGSQLRAAKLVFSRSGRSFELQTSCFFRLDLSFELQASCFFFDWIGAASCKPRAF